MKKVNLLAHLVWAGAEANVAMRYVSNKLDNDDFPEAEGLRSVEVNEDELKAYYEDFLVFEAAENECTTIDQMMLRWNAVDPLLFRRVFIAYVVDCVFNNWDGYKDNEIAGGCAFIEDFYKHCKSDFPATPFEAFGVHVD